MQTQATFIVPYIFTLLLVVGAVSFISITLLLYNKKVSESRKLFESLRHQFSQELLKSQLEIEQQTLDQLSRELHDDVGSTLSFVKLQLDNIDLHDKNAAGNKIEGAIDLLSKGIEKIRHISRWTSLNTLRSGGLENAMLSIVRQLENTDRYDIQISMTGVYHFFSEQKEIIIFRIYQEALNNIVRHAEATKIDISVTFYPERMILKISDNGRGFDESNVIQSGGLANMKTRASLLNTILDLRTAPGEGCVLSIDVNIKDNTLTDPHNDYHDKNSAR